jgi:hypothetical protein
MAPSTHFGELSAPANEAGSPLSKTVAGTLYLAGTVYGAFADTVVDASGDCYLDQKLSPTASQCGRQVWRITEWIATDSILSWRYWLPGLVHVVDALSFTLAATG